MRQSILDVAETLFLRDGYDLVTMEVVASAARVSKGTIYARYASKRDLYLAVMGAKLANLNHSFEQIAPADFRSFRAWFEAFARALLGALADPRLRAFEGLLGAQARRFPQLVSEFHQIAYAANGEINTRAIRAAARHFALNLADPEFLGEALRSLLWGWSRMAPVGGLPMTEVGRRAALLLLDGAGITPDDRSRSR